MLNVVRFISIIVGFILIIVWFILIMGYGLTYLTIGSMGIEYYLGSIASGICFFLACICRYTLPMTIGAFFGALNVLHWHWALAILFIAPGLALIIPGAIGFVMMHLAAKFKTREQ